MKKIVILGAGTGGTMMAAKLRDVLEPTEWQITVVDRDDRHLYQPGLLFIPFGIYTEKDLFKRRSRFIPPGVDFVLGEVDVVDPEAKTVRLEGDLRLDYDFLIVSTGSRIVPSETEGMLGPEWHKSVFDFYTVAGAKALAGALRDFRGGKLLVNLVDMPIKCPVAPLEFAFLAEWYFAKNGLRDSVEIEFATPLSGPFTRPRCSEALQRLFVQRDINVVTQFNAHEVDGPNRKLIGMDGTGLDYDMLVTIPIHRGSEVIKRSGMGDELDFIHTDPHTLRSEQWDSVFVIGDATNVPTSKAGSVAHFEAEVLTENIQRAIAGQELEPGYDGHTNCFIETGYDKGVLVDFNYEVEPLPGMYPVPGVGPFTLVGESEANHWGKLAFRWIYWNLLLKGVDLSAIGPKMSMAGKWS